MPEHPPLLPDELESVARTRHRVDGGTDVGPRRRINWPAGTVLTDDVTNEEVDVDLSAFAMPSGRISATTSGQIVTTAGADIDWSAGFTLYEQVGTDFDFNGVSLNDAADTLQILEAGVYALTVGVTFVQTTGTAGTFRETILWLDPTTNPPIGWNPVVTGPPRTTVPSTTTQHLSAVYTLAADSSITVTVNHDASTSLEVSTFVLGKRLD